MNVTLHIEGMRELVALCKSQDWYAKPWRKGMEKIGSQSGLAAQKGAPVRTGYLQSTIRTAVQQKPFPTWIAIRNRAVNKGYPYPRLLAFSPEHHHQNWLINAVLGIWRRSETVLNQIGEEIQRNWSRA